MKPDCPRATVIFLLHCLAGVFMTGVIWFVQVVHYPLFHQVGVGNFVRFEEQHALLTTFVVMPPMLVELVTAGFLVRRRPQFMARHQAITILLLTVFIWLLTFIVHLPQHELLGRGFSSELHADLVVTNWGRTILWTLKSGLAMWLLLRAMVTARSSDPQGVTVSAGATG
ncbi:MAG: hypothetical protein ACKVHO_09490 [Verrucomicrobiia bacterium]|jgi:hypothetical protein